MNKICGIYKITNTITNDFYIGSSKNVKSRWESHKWPSMWKKYPNNQLYLDMRKYGVDKFVFEILAEIEEDSLKEKEQQFIETLKPTYNQMNAKGLNIERCKQYQKEYQKNYREFHKNEAKQYQKEYQKNYREFHKNEAKQYQKQYNHQLCFYNGETLTLNALRKRFWRKGIDHPITEAKKYLLEQQ